MKCDRLALAEFLDHSAEKFVSLIYGPHLYFVQA